MASAEVAAEEELLGGVFVNGAVPSSSSMWARLVPLGGGAALIDANGNSSPSDRMPIKLQGSRYPAKTTPDGQWGWYDPEAADGPCRPGAPDKSEVHDLNKNNVPDGNEGGGIEKHCLKRGSYRVELLTSQFGSVVQSREIDKVRVKGVIGQKGIENPTLTSGGSTNVADVWVHFDTGSSSYSVSGTYKIDNARTSASYDTTGTTADTFRFDAQHTTTWPGTTRGELLAKYNWGDFFSSRFASTDEVIRVKNYGSAQTFPIQADVIYPRGSGITSQLRKVIVSAAVATVDVSPSSATITTQNGTTSLTATLRDANGNILTGRPVTWTSSNTTVATVSGSGGSATVTGKANGTATITATSEGKSDTSTITVSFSTGTDNAAAAGHTLPSSFFNGSTVSVTVSMKNTGTTTWSSAGGYELFQSQGLNYWAPGWDAVTGSIGPNVTHSFAFDLRIDDPDQRGTTPCFFRMQKSSYFGAENGRNIEVTGPKGGGSLAAMSIMGAGPAALGFDPAASWLTDAVDGGISWLPLDQAAFRASEVVLFEYSYAHEVARTVDVVFKFSYDPEVFDALPMQGGLAGIATEAGLGAPGEMWIRVSGVVPEGTGSIIELPFTLKPGARAPKTSSATLTIYYPQG